MTTRPRTPGPNTPAPGKLPLTELAAELGVDLSGARFTFGSQAAPALDLPGVTVRSHVVLTGAADADLDLRADEPLCLLGGLLLHVVVTLSSIIRFWAGLSPALFFKRIRSSMLTAFSTSSSAATCSTPMPRPTRSARCTRPASSRTCALRGRATSWWSRSPSAPPSTG